MSASAIDSTARSDHRSPAAPPLAVVTGMEHSGTTLLARLLCAHPQVEAGFECGLLLADSPEEETSTALAATTPGVRIMLRAARRILG